MMKRICLKTTFLSVFIIVSIFSTNSISAYEPATHIFEFVFVEVVDIFSADNLTLWGEHEYFTLRIIGNYKDQDQSLKHSSKIIGFDNDGDIPDDVNIGDYALVEIQTHSDRSEDDAYAINSMIIHVRRYFCCGVIFLPTILITLCAIIVVYWRKKKRTNKKGENE